MSAAATEEKEEKDRTHDVVVEKKNNKRIDRTSMEGMIHSANNVLETALNPNAPDMRHELWENCIGLAMISIIEAGFIFSGNVGTGILLKKQDDGTWSNPCAVGLTGVGWGLMAGGMVKEMMVFIFDAESMEAFSGDVGFRLGGEINVTLGPWGRNYEAGIGLSNKGAAGSMSISFSKGLFGGLAVEGAMLGPRTAVNDNFYGTSTNSEWILDNQVEFPKHRETEIDLVHEKLAKLSEKKPEPADSTDAAGEAPKKNESKEGETSGAG